MCFHTGSAIRPNGYGLGRWRDRRQCRGFHSRWRIRSSTSTQSSGCWAGHMRGCYLWGPFRAAGSSSLCEIQISRGPACDRLLVYHFRTLADPTLLSAVHGRVCNKPIHAQNRGVREMPGGGACATVRRGGAPHRTRGLVLHPTIPRPSPFLLPRPPPPRGD